MQHASELLSGNSQNILRQVILQTLEREMNNDSQNEAVAESTIKEFLKYSKLF